MVVVAALPQLAGKWCPSVASQAMSIASRRQRFKALHRIWQGKLLGQTKQHQNAMDMVGHNHKGVKVDAWIVRGQSGPDLLHHLASRRELHQCIGHLSKT